MPLAGKQHNHQAVLDAPKSSGYSLIQLPRSHKRYEPMVPASSRKHGICIYIYPSLALSKNVIKKMIHQPWDLLRFCIFRSTPLAINHGNGKITIYSWGSNANHLWSDYLWVRETPRKTWNWSGCWWKDPPISQEVLYSSIRTLVVGLSLR